LWLLILEKLRLLLLSHRIICVGNRNERASVLNDKVKKPLKATGTKPKQLAEQSRLPKTSRAVPMTSLSPNISPANGIGRSLNQFIEACNQMDSPTSPLSQQPKFRGLFLQLI